MRHAKFFVTKTGRKIHVTPTCESIVGRYQTMLETCEHCMSSGALFENKGKRPRRTALLQSNRERQCRATYP